LGVWVGAFGNRSADSELPWTVLLRLPDGHSHYRASAIKKETS
jgi:hypothetical protein